MLYLFDCVKWIPATKSRSERSEFLSDWIVRRGGYVDTDEMKEAIREAVAVWESLAPALCADLNSCS